MMKIEDVVKNATADEIAWLEREIALVDESFEDEPCKDNYRFCLVGDAVSEQAYEDALNEGCCGSHNVVLGPSPLGNTYEYGFNYGH